MEKSEKREVIQAVISFFEGMDGWNFIALESWRNIHYISVNPNVMKALNLIVEKIDDVWYESRRLSLILEKVSTIQHRQENPIYDHNTTPSVPLKDKGLKMAVINQLMFLENKLKPRFDYSIFAEEYKERCLDYEFIPMEPEAESYFSNLDIPQFLLNEVKTLKLDKKALIYSYFLKVFYFCLPLVETGKFYHLTSSAVEDLDYLPNLKEIHISDEYNFVFEENRKNLENSDTINWIYSEPLGDTKMYFPKNLLKAMNERRIKLLHGGKEVILP